LLKYGRAKPYEARRGTNNQPDRTSEMLKTFEAVFDLFKNAPALMAAARIGGAGDPCEKLLQPSATAPTPDRPTFSKLYPDYASTSASFRRR
jgi:hypothetical protein